MSETEVVHSEHIPQCNDECAGDRHMLLARDDVLWAALSALADEWDRRATSWRSGPPARWSLAAAELRALTPPSPAVGDLGAAQEGTADALAPAGGVGGEQADG